MIQSQLREFIAHVDRTHRITSEDVGHLADLLLEDGLRSREEAEALLALDRTVPAETGWADLLRALVVDFVVWGARPTGSVTRDDAVWLAAALDADAPTTRALRIAEAVADEADQVDESLVTFILRERQSVRTLAA